MDCATRRTGAPRQLRGQGLRSPRATRRIAVATPAPLFFLEDVDAVRADPSRVHDAAVMRAPQTWIMLNDGPLHPLQRRHNPAVRPFAGSQGRALSRCSVCATLMYLAKVASGIQPSHSACVGAITGARESDTGSSSFPTVIRDTLTMQPFRQAPRRLGL